MNFIILLLLISIKHIDNLSISNTVCVSNKGLKIEINNYIKV